MLRRFVYIMCLFMAVCNPMNSQIHLKKDTAVREGKLPNGLTYYIRCNKQTPGQADFYLAQRVGSILEEPQQRGLAHFLEHMAFNGTKHFPFGNGEQGSIRNWCESNGIKFGADLNACTSIDKTIFNISNAPVSKAGVADTCLLILRDWSNDLLLRDAEIDKERGIVREEWRARRSNYATTRMMEDAMPTIYKGSKYEDCLPIGYVELIDTFHYEALRDYYHKWYRTDLQAVIVVGDIDMDKTETQIKALFSDIKLQENAPERIYYPIPDNKEMIVYTQADEEQPTLNFSLYMKRDAEPRGLRDTRKAFINDYKSRMAMFILRQRLMQLTKEAPIRLMSVGCRDNSYYVTNEKDAFALTINLLPNTPATGINAAIEVVEKARRYGFTEAELGHAKDQFMVDVEHKRDTKEKTRNGEYVRKILDHFINGEALLDLDYRAELEAEMAELVTLEDVNKAVKDIVTNRNQVCIIFGPTHYGTDSEGRKIPYTMPLAEDFRNWIVTAQQKDYADDAKTEQVDFSFMKKLPKKGRILAKRLSTNGYTEYLLSNGVRVHARPSKIEPGRVTIEMFRLGGRSLYPIDDAVSLMLLGSVVRESGAADFDYLTLEKKRRGKALRVVPYMKSEDEGVNGVCANTDFKTWLEICHLYITQPRRNEAMFNSIMQKQASIAKNRTANPNVIYNDSVKLIAYGEDKRTLPITEERLKEANLDRIYEIYQERFSNMAGMNMIVTGDIREDEFEDLICQYVASLPGKRPAKALVKAFIAAGEGRVAAPAVATEKVGSSALDIREVNETHIFHLDVKTPSTLTNIVYSADLPYSAGNDLKVDVLSQIMRAVLTEKMREEKGATYDVSVTGQTWKFPTEGCSLTLNFRCAAEKYEELIGIINEQMALMAQEGPSEEELQKVKEYELKNYNRAIQTNGWWEYVRYHELREGVNYEKDYTSNVNALTPADIRDIARLLLSSNNRIQVTMK